MQFAVAQLLSADGQWLLTAQGPPAAGKQDRVCLLMCLIAYHRLLPKFERRLHCCMLRPVETADQRKARKQAEADRAHAQVQSLSGLSKFGPVKDNADLSHWAVAEVCRLSGATAQHRAEPKFLEA